MSLNISLPPELENRVRQHVESGLYSSAREVIRGALRLFEAYRIRLDRAQPRSNPFAGRVRSRSVSALTEDMYLGSASV